MSKPKLFALFASFISLSLFLAPSALAGSPGDTPHLNGSDLNLFYVLPFVGILLSIALFPLLAPQMWHSHFGKISVFWALAFLIPFTIFFGISLTLFELFHVVLLEYLPFIILLFSLFTVSGGIRLKGNLVGTPRLNTGILLFGTIIASWMGTTGAAMLLIRPLCRAIEHRKYKVHTIIFFIFLVANIGGSLTPLGDPPLFLGFLQGVSFFWPTQHMYLPMLMVSGLLLVLYFLIDSYLHRKENGAEKETEEKPADERSNATASKEKFGLEGCEGLINIPLLVAIVGAVLFSGFMQKDLGEFIIYDVHIKWANLIRDVSLLVIAGASIVLTKQTLRKANGFTWFPIIEVALLFIGIFITIIPAIAILKAGQNGDLAFVIDLVTTTGGQPNNAMYFWATGLLSGFLDNAPTYLVFFNAAGGDANALMSTFSKTLLAISAGAVFMGALTYIGNAPNFMVRSIAEDRGIKMPSFFGYMAWSISILVPIFVIVTFVFFTESLF